jgi:hypothetical protein
VEGLDVMSIVEKVSRLLAVLGAAAGVIYAVGFVVINSSLLRVGVYDLALLRTGYLSVGIVYVLIFSVILGISITAVYVLDRVFSHAKDTQTSRVWHWSLFGVVVLLLLILFYAFPLTIGFLSLYFKGDPDFDSPNDPLFYWSLAHLIFSFLAILVGVLFIERIWALFKTGRQRRDRYAGWALVSILGVLLNESETSHFQDTPFREIVTKRPR